MWLEIRENDNLAFIQLKITLLFLRSFFYNFTTPGPLSMKSCSILFNAASPYSSTGSKQILYIQLTQSLLNMGPLICKIFVFTT